MDRLVIQRKSKNLIRESIAKILGSSLKDLRNFSNGDIVGVLDKLDFTKPYVPEKVFSSDLYSEKDINDFLDYLYIDLMIQYGDLFNLRDALTRIRAMFVDTVIPQVIKAGEISAEVRNLKKLENTKYSFTDIVSESFNKAINRYPYSEKLSINAGAGIVRLPGIERHYARPEYTNIRIDVISGGCKLIDSSDSLNSYNNDPLSPFYINAISTTAPININKGSLEFEDYSGIICDIVISFPDIVPISRIGFTQFSDSPFRIIQVQSSTMANQNIHYSSFEQISIRDISYDNNEIEINFDLINTRELHIFVLQNKYKSTREAVKIALYKHIDDYLKHCSTAMRSIDNRGFSENEDISLQLNELFTSIKNNTKFPVESIKENVRSYTIGLYNLKVANVIYSPVGYYTSDNYDVNGNIMNLSFNYEGLPVVEVNDQPIAATLFQVETANNSIYMGTTATTGEVYDISTLELNTSYVDKELEINEDYPIKLYTHFLPSLTTSGDLVNFRICFDDETILLTSSDYKKPVAMGVYNAIVEINNTIVKRYNLNDGVTVITKYPTAESDCYGNPYSPYEIDIVSRIGKPNVVNHRILPVPESYMYVQTEISGEPYTIGYSENEYGRVKLSGEIYYALGTGKGEPSSFPDIVHVTKNGTTSVYAHNSLCTVPIDNMYASYNDQAMSSPTGTAVIDSKNYLMYKTEKPYIKNTIKIYNGDTPLINLVEYDDDVYQDIVPLTSDQVLTQDKRTVYILSGSYSDINAYYAPIDNTELYSNIASHNVSETFTSIPSSGMKLTRYPYLDMDIVNAECFSVKDGIFTYQPLFSIIYEPVTLYVNGMKAKNITRYRSTDPEIDKRLTETSREDEYMYYLSEDGIIIPNREMTGNIVVQYYSMSDSLRGGLHMAKSNLYRDDLTPEIYDFTILANTKR